MLELDEVELKDEIVNELKNIDDFVRYLMTIFDQSDIYFGHGAVDPYEEAILLLSAVLNLNFEDFSDYGQARLTKRERENVAKIVTKRIFERIPTSYLTNISWFCNIPFYVDERVLIPRSPIAQLIKDRFTKYLPQEQEEYHILDLCTGSGCIAIATALYFKGQAMVDAVDLSEDALEVCYTNVENLEVEHLVTPIQSDLFERLEGIKYDLIVCNPPYVDQIDLNEMPDEFLCEPRIALEAGEDGLEIAVKILREAPKYMKDHSYLICEVGNSMIHLQERYPDFKFNFIDFDNGAVGVFAITKEELLGYKF